MTPLVRDGVNAPYIAPQPPSPATPHAFGCARCVTATRGRIAAEHVASRLLGLLYASEERERRQRDEIAGLEERLTRHGATWETP